MCLLDIIKLDLLVLLCSYVSLQIQKLKHRSCVFFYITGESEMQGDCIYVCSIRTGCVYHSVFQNAQPVSLD